MRNEKGFTLIEIIAVLVILGILAAVAIPKYVDIQTEARKKVLQGAVAALHSHATQHYAKGLLNGSFNGTFWIAPGAGINVGDFEGSITGAGPQVNINVTAGPEEYSNDEILHSEDRTFNLW